MVLARTPALMTKRLRQIITRDTIIATHIVFSIAAVLDSYYIEDVGPYDRYFIVALVLIFMVVGVNRLLRVGNSERAPINSINAYQSIGTPTVVYLSDIRSFWPFFWLIPIFLASFYYGKRMLYISFTWFTLVLAAQLIVQQQYIHNVEDYFYVLAELLVVGAFSLIFRDSLEVTNEDRQLLIDSLDKASLEEERL